MKAILAASLTSLASVTSVIAAPTQVSFVASVTFAAANSPYATFGPTVAGSYFFDYDPAAYSVAVNPGEGSNWGAYEYIGLPYGLTANLPELSTTVPTGVLGLEVYDNGSLIPATGITSDSVFFGAKRNAVSYVLRFTGPNSTFSTNALPTAFTLTGPWTTSNFVIRDSSRNVVLTAAVTQVQVSSVPEASALSYGLFGTAALLAIPAMRRRAFDA